MKYFSQSQNEICSGNNIKKMLRSQDIGIAILGVRRSISWLELY